MKTLTQIVNEVDAGIDALKATISWICTDVYGINKTVVNKREIVTHTRSFTIEIELVVENDRVVDDIHVRFNPNQLQDSMFVATTIQKYLETMTMLVHKLAYLIDSR